VLGVILQKRNKRILTFLKVFMSAMHVGKHRARRDREELAEFVGDPANDLSSSRAEFSGCGKMCAMRTALRRSI
jgi:hypothetical protein